MPKLTKFHGELMGRRYPLLTLYSDTGKDDAAKVIPLQAVSDRMELLGLHDSLESLGWIGWSHSAGQEGDRILNQVMPVYGELVREEGAALLAQGEAARVQQTGRARSVLRVGGTAVCEKKLDSQRLATRRSCHLRDNCTPCVQPERMESEDAVYWACEMLYADKDCLHQALAYIDGPECQGGLFDAFRVETAAVRSPHIEQYVKKVRQ